MRTMDRARPWPVEEVATSLGLATCYSELPVLPAKLPPSALVMRLTPDLGFWADAGPSPEVVCSGGAVQKVEAGSTLPVIGGHG